MDAYRDEDKRREEAFDSGFFFVLLYLHLHYLGAKHWCGMGLDWDAACGFYFLVVFLSWGM